MIQLTPEDHAAVCRAIGGMSLDESHQVLYTKSAIWPPKGLPDGLYKDVISARFLSQIRYHACSLLFNVLLVSQLVIGAIITALSAGDKAGTAITVIAACNTVVAGMLALVNGSGAPDRYKNDAIEFEKVEKFMEEIMYGGIVKEGITKEHVIAECFDQYSKARATQASNKPGTYTATAADKGGMTTVGK
ncbi:hypothetical protein BJ878DRAFT_417380 [Calycina marina]|uniref:SMODS and SLOG-associating 2TM effector domain-containing protein n=1 Tax=Calycina marina TaxID=1763456 RepID=A0A9P7Z6Y9_9HELO|nr:hypothetical protein BJ878DRAFT_417380 [Calycina marina]